jgi:hypothetical protein
VALIDRTAALRRASCLGAALVASGCGIETSGFVLHAIPGVDASIDREAGAVDATFEEACATCPRTIVFSDPTNTPQPGGDGGAPSLDVCPEGQVVIGYNGSLNSTNLSNNGMPITVIGSIQTVCGRITVDDPSAIFASIKVGDTLAPHPNKPNSWNGICPSDKAVVGFMGGSGDAFDRVAFQCTGLRITKGPTGDVLSPDVSTIQVLSANGGDAASAMFSEVCPEGKVAQGSNVRIGTSNNGGSWVEAFGIVCATPNVVPVDAGAPCCTMIGQQTSSRAVDKPPLP